VKKFARFHYIRIFVLTIMLSVAAISFQNEAPVTAKEELPSTAHVFVPGEVLIKFNGNNDIGQDRISLLLSGAPIQLTAIKSYPHIEGLKLYTMNIALNMKEDMKKLLAELHSMPYVEYAQPNFVYHLSNTGGNSSVTSPPPVTGWNQLWGLANSGEIMTGQDADDERMGMVGFDIRILQAWTITRGKPSVIVAVADDGVDPNHPEFTGRVIQDNQANPIDGHLGDEDEQGELYGNHGTHAAGTIAASYGSGKMVGVAPEVRLLPINILGSPAEAEFNDIYGTSDIAAASIFYALEHGAKVINNSWGSERWEYKTDADGNKIDKDGQVIPVDENDEVEDKYKDRLVKVDLFEDLGNDMVLRDAIKSVENQILYVVAAGNESNNNDQFLSVPDVFGSNRLKDFNGNPLPALRNVISVAAVDNIGDITDFSNYGKASVHIAAPGWGIYSTFVNGKYGIYDGTSMAAPHISGVAALMYSVNPDLTPAEVIEIIMTTGRTLPKSSERTKLISGKMVDAYAALLEVQHRMGVNVQQSDATGAAAQPSAWAVAEINEAIANKLTTPKVLNHYTQDITREEFAELVVKLYEALTGLSVPLPSLNKFSDTSNQEILKANALGIVNGISDTEFAPNANVTREQIATMFYRTLQAVDSTYIAGSYEPTFADKSDISSWALQAVGFMNNKGILGGVGDNKVAPKGLATREQAIALVIRTYIQFGN
jgi:subtilisin family serine protease